MLKPYNLAQVQFAIGDEIGEEGKNSRVFVAHDPQLSANIVVKKIEKAKIADVDEYFVESSLLYAGSHTNVVPILYACQDDDHIYVAMPYFARGSLKSMMNQTSLSLREIVVLATQFLSGLHHIHSKRLIHFDIKPDNILISDRGEAVLSDFGLTKQTELTGHAAQDRIYGKMTPPEAFDTDQFTTRFDIYQAGLTLYRMCVGDSMFYEQYAEYVEDGVLDRGTFQHAVRNEQFPDRSAFPEHIPIGMRNTVRKCMKSNRAERCASALEIVNELASLDGAILDWRYKLTCDGKEWTKATDERSYRLLVAPDGKSTATRQVGDGEIRKISAYCQDEIGANDIRRFLGAF